ncbi:poly cid1 family protein [Cystoisospora suis]|uniref:Poly cid1 family protein n=1 Tax=Cystoisospora suis TaxID=483139 RepID=A0A2C6L714_9APIC|nr:poly cid1 family protein [Cystoisospora suis]
MPFHRRATMGLLCCQDLLRALQDNAGQRVTCCCCCCCGGQQTLTPGCLQRFLKASLQVLQEEAERVIPMLLPGASRTGTWKSRPSQVSLQDSYPLLVNPASIRKSVYVGYTMTPSEESRVLPALLLSPRRAAQLVEEVTELGQLKSKQRGSSRRSQRLGERFSTWHAVYRLINWELNDIAICNVLHLLSKTNSVKYALRYRFSTWVDRLLSALLRRILDVCTPVSLHQQTHATQPAPEIIAAACESSLVFGKTLTASLGCSATSHSSIETSEYLLPRLCLTYFCGLLFRIWAPIYQLLDDPNAFPTIAPRREVHINHEDITACCTCCSCAFDRALRRPACPYHSAGKRVVLGKFLKKLFDDTGFLSPISSQCSVDAQLRPFGMRSLLLPSLLMVWRDPRFPFIFPAQYAQSFDSLIHFLHRYELLLLRCQHRRSIGNFLGFPFPQEPSAPIRGEGLKNDASRQGIFDKKWDSSQASPKITALLWVLQAGEGLRQGSLQSLQQQFMEGFRSDTGELKTHGRSPETKSGAPVYGTFQDTLIRECGERWGHSAAGCVPGAGKALRYYHASALLQSFGAARLPRNLGTDDVTKPIGQYVARSLLDEVAASRRYDEARAAATDFVASVSRWVWGRDVKTRSRGASGDIDTAPEGKDVNGSSSTVRDSDDDEDDCGVWLWQFGSAVNGFCTAGSDVDICVLLGGEELRRQQCTSFLSRSGEAQRKEDLRKFMLSWHEHETEFSEAEGAVRLLGEVFDGIRLAQNVEDDIVGEWQEEKGACSTDDSKAAARRLAHGQTAEKSHQPRLKIVAVEPISWARVPICRIEFLYGTWSDLSSSPSSCVHAEQNAVLTSSGIRSSSQILSESNILQSSDSDIGTSVSTASQSPTSTFFSTPDLSQYDAESRDPPASRTRRGWSWKVVKVEVSFSNRLGILNTRYISCLAGQKPLGFALAASVKLWASRRGIANAYKGYLSPYAWLLLAFHFLACREKPIIINLLRPPPSVLEWANMERPALEFWNGVDNCWFFDPWVPRSDVRKSRMAEALSRGVWRSEKHRHISSEPPPPSGATFYPGTGVVDPETSIFEATVADGGSSLAELLYEFFRFYAYEFNPYLHVVSLRYNAPPASPLLHSIIKEPEFREAIKDPPGGQAGARRPGESAACEAQVQAAECKHTDALKGSSLWPSFPGLRDGVFLSKLDFNLWVNEQTAVPVHEHHWYSLGLSSEAFTRGRLLGEPKTIEALAQKHGGAQFTPAMEFLALEALLEMEETEYPHVLHQRRWLKERERVSNANRLFFQEKYKRVGRKKDIVQFDTLVVEDPFRELDLLEPKFENQDRLFYELKRATHLLAAAAAKPPALSSTGASYGAQARRAVEALFCPFDATAEKDILRQLSDVGRFAKQGGENTSNEDACCAHLEAFRGL